MSESSSPLYVFGPFVLDAGKRLLFCDGAPVPLAPKVLDTLVALIERRGYVVSKDQLLSRVWGDTVVEEGGLARNISLLRKTLGEKPDDHRYVVTVPARGYRFVAEVHEQRADERPERRAPAQTAWAGSDPASRGHSTALWWVAGVVAFLLAAAPVVWRSGASSTFRPEAHTNPRLIRLTSTSGLNTDPAFSPDGSLIAYASDRAGAGNLDIWVQPARGGTATRITSGDGDEVEPSFSPDGSSIVYAGGEAGGIYIVGALGGEARLIVRGTRTRTPRFSPDGRSILYWVGQTAWVILPGSTIPGATGTLSVVSSSGGTPRSLAPEFASARYGVWSPDGKRILFLGERAADGGASLDWYVIDPDGGAATRTGALDALRAMRLDGAPIPGAWTSDGVVFTTSDETTANVWQLPVSLQSGRVAGAARRLTFGTALERSASASAAGQIAFTTLTENVDVWRVPLDSRTGTANGPPERVTDNAAPDRAMNVSADGRLLAFVSARTGRDEVWLKDLYTGAERQLTYSGVIGARLSPDGRRVAVQRQIGERTRVELFDASNGQSSILCDDCDEGGGGWSSDGSRLLIGKRRGAVGLILDLASGREVEVVHHLNWSTRQARFSPDDLWVVFHMANTPNLRQVYAVPVSSKMPPPLDAWVPVVPDFGIYPVWSRDGAGVYHFSLRDGYMCAWLQPVDPVSKRPIGAPRAVQHFHQPRLRAATRATPGSDVVDGAMYITLTETTGNIWMLDATAK